MAKNDILLNKILRLLSVTVWPNPTIIDYLLPINQETGLSIICKYSFKKVYTNQ
jgi:hypothetical protein